MYWWMNPAGDLPFWVHPATFPIQQPRNFGPPRRLHWQQHHSCMWRAPQKEKKIYWRMCIHLSLMRKEHQNNRWNRLCSGHFIDMSCTRTAGLVMSSFTSVGWWVSGCPAHVFHKYVTQFSKSRTCVAALARPALVCFKWSTVLVHLWTF